MKLQARILIATVALLAILIGLQAIIVPKIDSGIDWNKNVSSTFISAAGEKTEFDGARFQMADKGDVVVVTVKLPLAQRVQDGALLFDVTRSVVTAYFEDNILYTQGADRAQKGDLIGVVYPQIPIPDEAWGHEIKLVLKATENDAFAQINGPKVYPQLKGYQYYSTVHIIEFVLILLGMAGLLITTIILCVMFKGRVRVTGLFVVGFALMFSIRAFIYYGFYHLFSDSYIWTVLEYLSQALATVCLMWHLYLVNDKYKRVWKVLAYVNSAFFIFICFAHFAKIWNFHEMLAAIAMFAITDCIFLIIFIAKGRQTKKSVIILRAGIFFMAGVLMVDLVRFLLSRYSPSFYQYAGKSIMVLAVCVYILMLLCYLFVYIWEERDKDLRAHMEAEQSILQLQNSLELNSLKMALAQIQPHFIYNVLSTIQVIVKRDPDYAYNLLYDFMIYLRANIHNLQNDELIPFDKELENIRAYLSIETMRYPGLLKIEYDLEYTDFDVAPLTIEPFVENAAEHGLLPRHPDGGKIIIRSYETDEHICIEVIDDGVGFDTAAMFDDTHVGLKNIKYRLETLMNAEVEIESKLDHGTKAAVFIPKRDS